MSKIVFSANGATNQTAAPLPANRPTQPLVRLQTMAERRTADPSAGLPKGRRYPIPTFFEYRANPKEADPQ